MTITIWCLMQPQQWPLYVSPELHSFRWDSSAWILGRICSKLQLKEVSCHEIWTSIRCTLQLHMYIYVKIWKSDHLCLHTYNSTTPGIHVSEDQFRYFISHCSCSFKKKRKLCGLVWFFGVFILGFSQPFTSQDFFRTMADLTSLLLLTTASPRSGNDYACVCCVGGYRITCIVHTCIVANRPGISGTVPNFCLPSRKGPGWPS